MKHLPTTVLLDLAEDVNKLAGKHTGLDRYAVVTEKIIAIDTELLSRMPEGEFTTVYDCIYSEGESASIIEFLPIGFEPYIGEDNEYTNYQNYQGYSIACQHDWVEGYYGIRCSKCDAFVADGHGPWMPVDEGRL